MPSISVSTADSKPVRVTIDIQGYAMDEVSARKFAQDIRSDLRWKLGISGDDEGMLVVDVTADSSSPTDDSPENPDEAEEAPAVTKATAAEIAAMTPAEYKTAKADGRI